MKMIGHQTIGEQIGNRMNVFEIEIHKIGIVALFSKNALLVVAAIENVIVSLREQWVLLFHFSPFWPTSKTSKVSHVVG